MTGGGKKSKLRGFTLIELLIAIALGIVVLTVMFSTFKSQLNSYSLQSQVSMAQQNLRAALYMITRDVQMAGYYTDFVHSGYSSDWDDNAATPDVAIKPLIYLVNDADKDFFPEDMKVKVKDKTDIIVIVKASDKHRELVPGESATAGDSLTAHLDLSTMDLENGGNLNYYSGAKHSKYGLLVKKDLSRAEVFEVDSSNNFVFKSGLTENYNEGDSIYKLDVIMYLIDNSDPAHPSLERRNIGTDNSFTLIAQDIENLQFEFMLKDGSIVKNLDNLNDIPLIRAVKVYILARSENKIKGYTDPNSYEMGSIGVFKPSDGYMRRLLSATIKTRNIGQ